jgi:hypothetical protein
MTILHDMLVALGIRPRAVDVAKLLDDRAVLKSQPYDWRHSIVDLLKLLDIDPSFENRRDLAEELGYPYALNGDAAMNEWLHREVMRRVSENGGVVPEELKG